MKELKFENADGGPIRSNLETKTWQIEGYDEPPVRFGMGFDITISAEDGPEKRLLDEHLESGLPVQTETCFGNDVYLKTCIVYGVVNKVTFAEDRSIKKEKTYFFKEVLEKWKVSINFERS